MTLRIDPALRAKIPQFQAMFRQKHDVRLSITDVIEMGLSRLLKAEGIIPADDGDKSQIQK